MQCVLLQLHLEKAAAYHFLLIHCTSALPGMIGPFDNPTHDSITRMERQTSISFLIEFQSPLALYLLMQMLNSSQMAAPCPIKVARMIAVQNQFQLLILAEI